MDDTSTDATDVVKEMYDGDYDRVDIVAGPASGLRFVVLKADQSAADYDQVIKVKYTAEQLRHMLARGEALANGDGDPSYPIGDRDDLERAVRAVGRGGADHDRIRAYIIRRARALGAESMIPADWSEDGSIHSYVAKAADAPSDEAPEADGDSPEDGSVLAGDPTSPEWEAADADRARQAINMVLALQRLIEVSVDREQIEASVDADSDDAGNVFDLCQVLDALDCVLDTLAPFAVGEEAEAENRQTVTKSGRTLTGVDEGLIREAVNHMQQALVPLPEPEGAPVAKSEMAAEAADTNLDAVDTEPVAKAEESEVVEPVEAVEKAADSAEPDAAAEKTDEPLLVVFDQSGRVIGAVDPKSLTPLTVGGSGDEDETADSPEASDAADDEDETPVAKAADPVEDPNLVLKSILADTIKEALAPLEDRVAKMETTPRPGGPLLSGATGQLFLRGQNTGAEDPEIEAVRKAMDAATNPVEKADLNRQLVLLQLRAMHSPS